MTSQVYNIKFEKSSFAQKVEKQFGKGWLIEQTTSFDLYYNFQACIDAVRIITPFKTEIIKTGFYRSIY